MQVDGEVSRPDFIRIGGCDPNSGVTECCHKAFHEIGAEKRHMFQQSTNLESSKPRNPKRPKTKKRTTAKSSKSSKNENRELGRRRKPRNLKKQESQKTQE